MDSFKAVAHKLRVHKREALQILRTTCAKINLRPESWPGSQTMEVLKGGIRQHRYCTNKFPLWQAVLLNPLAFGQQEHLQLRRVQILGHSLQNNYFLGGHIRKKEISNGKVSNAIPYHSYLNRIYHHSTRCFFAYPQRQGRVPLQNF